MNAISGWFLGSRKFLVMLATLLLGASFRICNLISGSDMVSLFSSVGVAFMGANTVEHMFAAAKDWIAAKQEQSNDKDEE